MCTCERASYVVVYDIVSSDGMEEVTSLEFWTFLVCALHITWMQVRRPPYAVKMGYIGCDAREMPKFVRWMKVRHGDACNV